MHHHASERRHIRRAAAAPIKRRTLRPRRRVSGLIALVRVGSDPTVLPVVSYFFLAGRVRSLFGFDPETFS